MNKNQNKIVEEPIKENGICIFTDIECKADKKVCYTWTSLFQAFEDKEFVVLLQNDARTELSKEIYLNIVKLGLHQTTVKTPILSCPNVIELISKKIDHQHQSILYFKGTVVSHYKPSMINQMYHLKEANIKVSPEWLRKKS